MSVATARHEGTRVGALLRDWRQRRHISQMELALDAGISTRHLSCVETGRSQPSVRTVLRLAEQLDVPLRERNHLLLAAGFAPAYEAYDLDEPALAIVRDAISHVLTGHEPYPALAVDRYWTLLSSNRALAVLMDGVAPHLLEPPVNTIRVALHPDGMAPRIVNLGEFRGDILRRLEHAARLTGDEGLVELHEEMLGYPGEREARDEGQAVMVPLVLDSPAGSTQPRLSFFSTISRFGTAVEITAAEMAIEAMFPADETTAAFLRTR